MGKSEQITLDVTEKAQQRAGCPAPSVTQGRGEGTASGFCGARDQVTRVPSDPRVRLLVRPVFT